jgi:hypothetical protein
MLLLALACARRGRQDWDNGASSTRASSETAKSHPRSLTNSIGATPQPRVGELNLGRLPCVFLAAVAAYLPGSEVPDAIEKHHDSLQSRPDWARSPQSTCQTNQRRPVMTASPTHNTPHHATRYSRETAQWLATHLAHYRLRRGISMGGPKADDLRDPNCLMTGLSAEGHIQHVRPHEEAGWLAGCLNCRIS